MTQIRFKGFRTGSTVELANVTVGADSGSLSVASFRKPSAVTAMPRLNSGQHDDETLSLDTTGLTGITAYRWREVSGAVLGTASTFAGAGHGGKFVQPEVDCDQGSLVGPAVMIYASDHMGMAMQAGHIADDKAVLELVPHHHATHISIASGSWSDPTTWHNGEVPKNGAFPLVAHGHTVVYDNTEANIRLDRLRIDGTFDIDAANLTTEQLKLLVETVVTTRGGSSFIGTQANRVPASASFECTFSGKDYSSDSFTPTSLKPSNFSNTRGWGRGWINQGLSEIWGKRQLTASIAAFAVPQGATSLVLEKEPVGVSAGDTILISSTTHGWSAAAPEMGKEIEERVLTDVIGHTLYWSDPLVYSHSNQLMGSTRTDIRPVVIVKAGKNVTFRSEVPEVNSQRGHRVNMHHWARVDHWDYNLIDLGRTDKLPPSGVIDENGDFKYVEGVQNVTSEALEPESNLQSRYPEHLHHMSFDEADRAIIHDAYVEGAPGWGIVHHFCRADILSCAVYDFWGAGFVSESGNEVGLWNDNVAMKANYDHRVFPQVGFYAQEAAKNLEVPTGIQGDNARHGYGFFFRGRAVRGNRNFAADCCFGYVFYHRNVDSQNNPHISFTANIDRAHVDLKEAGLINNAGQANSVFRFRDYPIMHMANNYAIACVQGMNVVKPGPAQNHDVHIRFDRFTAWGCYYRGAAIEYVGKYILNDFDIVAGATQPGGAPGIVLDANAYQIGVVRARVEGYDTAVYANGTIDTSDINDLHDQANPVYFHVGLDAIDCTHGFRGDAKAGATKTIDQITFADEDWDGAFLDYDADPSTTVPPIMGTWTGTGWATDNAWGVKSDNLSASGNFLAPLHGDNFVIAGDVPLSAQGNLNGMWDYSGTKVYAFPDIIADRLTARPLKRMWMIEVTDASVIAAQPQNGALTYSSTPIAQADKAVGVAENGTTVIDMVTGATGGGAIALDTGDHIATNHGKVILDDVAGTVTFEADRDYVGTDVGYFFLEREGQYATVRTAFLIGPGGPVTAPAITTNFTVADHADANTIGVTLGDQPACGGRFIETVQYSTDGGVTWRRLCHQWKPATIKVTVESDETAIAGGSYNVRLRYLTDYDRAISPESADAAVTVA